MTTTSKRDVMIERLETELRSALDGEVRFDAGSRALYATDASNYRQVPVGVVIPRHRNDVIRAMEICHRHGVPVLGRGGGTSLAGQCCNVAVIFDLSKYMHRVLDIDVKNRTARVEPGIVLDALQAETRPHGLIFGPDPSTHNRCTLGGMIGNNACGVHSVVAGRTADNVESLEILTYSGEVLHVGPTSDDELASIIREGGARGRIYGRLRVLRDRFADEIRKKFPRIPRRVSGYNLDALLPEQGFHVGRALTGTEGTCVMILSATVRLIPDAKFRVLAVLGFPDINEAADAVPEVLASKPLGLEGLDDVLIHHNVQKGMNAEALKLLPEGRGWLLAEFGGNTVEEAIAEAEKLLAGMKKRERVHTALCRRPEDQHLIWEVRESGLGATSFVPGQPDAWPGWEDSAVPPEKMGPYLRRLRALMNDYGYDGSFYGHFGDGCLHTRISFDFQSDAGVRRYREFMDRAADLVLEHGGSLSGEHGDGQARGELLVKMFGPELIRAFEEFKAIWDPEGKMNPGKVVRPYALDENLRLQNPLNHPDTHFRFPVDDGDFSRSVLRCVGVGKCRKEGSGTMCPSYMVAREEKHSTRGRARLLFEMLEGTVVTKGWKSEEVKEALDLCLACKGCKEECPVTVDMATYKAEFLSHYYEGRMRPRHAYFLGRIYEWARFGSRVPAVANFFSQTPPFASIAKWMTGIAPERKIPAFAGETFRHWFHRRKRSASGKQGQVLLWPDTFNNFFYPQILKSGVAVLERLGYEVLIPDRPLCCGRPLYDYGWLETARHRLEQTVDALSGYSQDIPLVGLEPSCMAVFRDELPNLLARHPAARKLEQRAMEFSEFLVKHTSEKDWPKGRHRILVQGHCHQKAVFGLDHQRRILEKTGMQARYPDTGCCGMAGAFGFEKEHYDISTRCAERVLIPEIKKKPEGEELLLADGFSCREQIHQMTGRRARHIAEILEITMNA